MVNTANKVFAQTIGSAFFVAARVPKAADGELFQQADIYSITETITDIETGQVVGSPRTLDKTDVVFDTPQTHPNVKSGQFEYNIGVVVPADKITQANRDYTYQLTIVPSDGEGGGDATLTQKTREITLRGDR